MRTTRNVVVLIVLGVLLRHGDSWAEGVERTGSGPAVRPSSVTDATTAGRFLPLTQPASASRSIWTIDGFAVGGYDNAAHGAMFEASAEARVWGPLSVRAGVARAAGTLRPTLGARLGLVSEAEHGLDLAVGAFYRAEGLTEPEGEVEAVVATGGHLGRTYALANLVYGQDPEGSERDGEVRIAAVHPVGERVFLGFDGRLRSALGSAGGRGDKRLDVLLGPLASVVVGPVALTVQAGAALSRAGDGSSSDAFGAFILAGGGTTF